MKGTIAILGCLIAAYAAPLFANEVPLILEETIQLPVATAMWDVVPTWTNGYHWVSAVETSDGNTRVYFGNSTEQTSDSTEVIRGEPRALSGFLQEGDEFCMALSTYRYYDLEDPQDSVIAVDTSWTRIETLPERFTVAPVKEFTGYKSAENRGDYIAYGERYQALLTQFEPIPSPPELSDSVAGLYSVTDGWGETGFFFETTKGKPVTNVFDTLTVDVGLSTSGAYIAYSQQAGHFYCATFGHIVHTYAPAWIQQRFCFSMFAHNVNGFDSLTQVSSEHTDEYSGARPPGSRLAVTYDSDIDSARALFSWTCGMWSPERRMCSVVAPNHITELNSSLGGYAKFMTAHVLPDSACEQVLGIGYPELHIINFSNGEVWGTIPLEPGFAEMKVVGRYQSERRRLVIRYGSELRIYRFGEPVLDADDTRPELPSELTLSAYPNPFNPTTMIAFDLPNAARASLVVYDLNGRLVQSLFDEQMSAGHHEVGFDGAALPSGIYFARLSAGDLTRTHKLVLMK